ncbi:MAG TPA: BadF/BadG/BcrA/BcrD ATPase family protein [Gaiellaceae bacterium]
MAGVPLILGVDGGNSKTELAVATLDGGPVAYLRGPGSNSHAVGPERTAAFLSGLVARAELTAPVVQGTFYLCGADIPADFAALTEALEQESWVERAAVDNDIFALLRAGTDAADAVAVVCGAGINCAGRSGDGQVVRYPSLGWESGDWGGSVMLGRDVLFLAARGEDGRGEPTVLAQVLRDHFDLPVDELGEAVRYGRISEARLGEVAPVVVDAAAAVARQLIERLAEEVVLMATRRWPTSGSPSGL